MAQPRSFAELWNWLQSVLPLKWDAKKKLVTLPGSLQFPDGTTQATAGGGAGGGAGGVTGTGTPGQLAAWTGTAALGNANEEGWHLVGMVGQPAFQNGWVNWS